MMRKKSLQERGITLIALVVIIMIWKSLIGEYIILIKKIGEYSPIFDRLPTQEAISFWVLLRDETAIYALFHHLR